MDHRVKQANSRVCTIGAEYLFYYVIVQGLIIVQFRACGRAENYEYDGKIV